MIKNVQIRQHSVLSDNWYILKKITYEASFEDGSTAIQSREVYDRGNDAMILLYNSNPGFGYKAP